MSEKAFDPVAAWQQMLQKWEHEVNSWSGTVTSREEFGAAMGQLTNFNLAMQKALGERMEDTLRSLNLPSKRQVDGLAERLDAIEESIERLRLALAPGATIPVPERRPEPRRSRKPPA